MTRFAPLLALALAAALIPGRAAMAERLVTGLSQDQVAITATFDGSDVLVYGAVARDKAPAPGVHQDIVITLQGPSLPLIVRKKERVFGIWANRESVHVDSAPSFYAVATTRPMNKVLTHTEDLRHHISIPLAIREIGGTATAHHPAAFVHALIKLRTESGQYETAEGSVSFKDQTLFSARIRLPANLTEGAYNLRIFLTQGGDVLDVSRTTITVHKAGIERWLFRLSDHQPLLYGLLSLFIAISAGWMASAAFRLLRR